MDTSTVIGTFAIIAGVVFFFTSGAFSLLSTSIGVIFQSIGIIFIYIGTAILLWNVLSSFNIFLERFGKRS